MTPTCDTCRYWVDLTRTEFGYADANMDEIVAGTGQCRFNPPVTRGCPALDIPGEPRCSGDAAERAYWPVTWDGHWCGQHRPRLSVVGAGA